MIRKAMLLAAGLGMRLRPLTLTTPKPMLPLNGHPLLAYNLGLLQRAGIQEIIINLHHLGDQIRDYCQDGSQWGMQIQYSEEPVILGSGGGLKHAETFFKHEPIIAINADTLLDIDLKKLVAEFSATHDGLMVTVPVAATDTYGRVTVDATGTLRGFGSGDVTFAGVQIVTPQLIQQLPQGVSSVIESGYIPLIAAAKTIGTHLHTGYWNDIGTPERYEQTQHDFAEGRISLQPVQSL